MKVALQLPELNEASPPVAGVHDVSVVLCAYTEQRWDDLMNAIESVRAQSHRAREIIVVIDHNPALLARAEKVLNDVLVVENQGSRGAGEARNAGVRVARGSILAFLDDDAIAAKDWIERALPAFDGPNVMGVGGTINAAWDGSAPRWFPAEFNWTVGCTYPGLPTTVATVRNLIAANMFVRRSLFNELGGFRADFGKTGPRGGCDETDLCLRASQRWRDREWLYDPLVTVRHRVPEARGRPGYFVSRCFDEGMGKAALVGFVGSDDGLQAERFYTRHTLPAGIAAGCRSAINHRDPMGFARSLSILAGLAITAVGYVWGRITAERRS